MNTMIELLKNQLLKMSHDGSWVFGAVGGGISFVFPDWITSKKLGIGLTCIKQFVKKKEFP
ncbi:hypothetical protein [Enterococcus durans]|uniref:hypothetical protein n=1 Tax=Enterococcus durans TaxID=53345 RepID=UPI00164A4CB3|nr:hypothetical protein [Enterococcus durans]